MATDQKLNNELEINLFIFLKKNLQFQVCQLSLLPLSRSSSRLSIGNLPEAYVTISFKQAQKLQS